MLLRSASMPIMNTSWIPQSKESEMGLPIPKSRLNSLSISSNSLSPGDESAKKMNRALSGSDLRELSVSRRKVSAWSFNALSSVAVEEVEEQEVGLNSRSSSLERLFSSSSLDGSLFDSHLTDWPPGSSYHYKISLRSLLSPLKFASTRSLQSPRLVFSRLRIKRKIIRKKRKDSSKKGRNRSKLINREEEIKVLLIRVGRRWMMR